MTAKVRATCLNCCHVLWTEVCFCDATVHLHRADSCHTDNHRWRQAGFAALDVQELLGTKVGAEARFGHDIVGQLQSGRGRDNRVTAVCDVREWATVNERRVVFQSLYKVWLHRVFQKNGHRTFSFDVAAENW